jgi:hypothetical protein
MGSIGLSAASGGQNRSDVVDVGVSRSGMDEIADSGKQTVAIMPIETAA